MSLASVTSEDIGQHLKNAYGLTDDKIQLMLDAAKGSLRENLAEAARCIQNENWSVLVRVAHSIKGALLNLGQEKSAGNASMIEKLAQAENEKEKCSQLLAELQESLLNITT